MHMYMCERGHDAIGKGMKKVRDTGGEDAGEMQERQ